MKIGILTLLASLCLVTSALSQAPPAIASIAQTSTTLTLNGLNFGAHADHGGPQAFLNAAWNDFAATINGGNLALSNTYPVAWTHMATGGRTPTKRWARHAWDPNGPDCCTRLGALEYWQTGSPTQVYSTFWMTCGANVAQAAKFWRIYGNNKDIFLSVTDGYNLMSYSNASGTPLPSTVWGVRTGPVRCATQWERWEVYMQDIAGNDLIEVHVGGQLAFRRSSQLPSNHIPIEGSVSNERQQWVTNPWGGNGHTIDFCHLVDGDFCGVSDAFVDLTRARVELSDQATWALSRHKEIQIPTQWADNRVVVQVNPGSFAAGQTVYAYVVHENGAVNATGFPVVLGGTTPPPVPVNCVTSEWSAWAATSETACVNNQKQVTEERSRTVITPPSNGGLACGPLSEVRTVTQTCTTPPPQPTGGCIDPATSLRYSKGEGPPIEEVAYTRTNANQRAIVANRMRTLREAGFLVTSVGKDGGWAFLEFTCNQ